jgi:plasmid stabilization system protein ParE
MAAYLLSPDALQDLQDIWDFVALDSANAADGLEDAFFKAFEKLATTLASVTLAPTSLIAMCASGLRVRTWSFTETMLEFWKWSLFSTDRVIFRK